MTLGGPYRPAWSPSWTEEELWLRLDGALLEVMVDPGLAWSIAWAVAVDSEGFPDVRRAAEAILAILAPPASDA